MGKILDAIRGQFLTRDIPKTPRGRLNALMRKEKNTARVAERLGVARSTVQGWVSGKRNIAKTTKPGLLDRLEGEVYKDHQPRILAQAQQDAMDRGLGVETRAQFGFESDAGSTDDPRMRRLTEDVPDDLVPDLFEAMRDGDEERLNDLLGEGFAREYFRVPGTEAAGLEVTLTDIDYVELYFRR